MKTEIIPGLDPRVFELIGPFAMNLKSVKQNGNPITTSNLHTWYVGFDEKGNISCFCSVKYAESSKNMQIGNMFILQGGKRTFNALIKQVIKNTAGKGLGLRAYANNKLLPDFQKLGFKVIKKGVNWHNLKYDNERVRSNTGETDDVVF